jgi:hypothetical protein
MSQTVDLNQVEPSAISPNSSPKPYPNWGRILTTTNAGHVNYSGLQSELNMRARSGLTFQASHVWAKSLGNVGGDAPTTFNPEIIYGAPVANRFDLPANRGNMAATRRQRFLLSAVYDLPVGQNSRLLAYMNRMAETVIGGWSLSTVTLWETGPYLTPTMTRETLTSPIAGPSSGRIVSVMATSQQTAARSTSMRSTQFRQVRWVTVAWESSLVPAPRRSQQAWRRISGSRSGFASALKERLQT